MSNCKVELRTEAVSLCLEGSEAFVTSTLESWKDLFSSAKSQVGNGVLFADQEQGPIRAKNGGDQVLVNGDGHLQFENVYDSADGKLKIIAAVPGTNKAESTRNTALIYLFGKYLNGIETVPSEEIRQACIDQGCYDSSNFALYMKGLKSRVVMNTKPGGGYDVKLTAPGRKDARDLVKGLNQPE